MGLIILVSSVFYGAYLHKTHPIDQIELSVNKTTLGATLLLVGITLSVFLLFQKSYFVFKAPDKLYTYIGVFGFKFIKRRFKISSLDCITIEHRRPKYHDFYYLTFHVKRDVHYIFIKCFSKESEAKLVQSELIEFLKKEKT
jgi:hypothetical protein